jgi:hypothetical protein
MALPIDKTGDSLGLLCVLMGGFGLLSTPANFVWCANLTVWMSWTYLKKGNIRRAKVFTSVSLAIAGAYLFCDKIVDNEGGVAVSIHGYGPGYWVWLASMMAAFLGAFLPLADSEKKSECGSFLTRLKNCPSG